LVDHMPTLHGRARSRKTQDPTIDHPHDQRPPQGVNERRHPPHVIGQFFAGIPQRLNLGLGGRIVTPLCRQGNRTLGKRFKVGAFLYLAAMGCAGFRVDVPADGDSAGIGSWEHLASKSGWQSSSTWPIALPATGRPQEPGCPVPGLGPLGLCPTSDLQAAVQLSDQLCLTKDGDHFGLLGGLGIPAQMADHRCSLEGGLGHLQSKA
jgi:hypothetical protein